MADHICNAYLSWHRSRLFSHNHSNFFFFQVTMIPVYKKAVLSLGGFQRYSLYRDMHSNSPQIPRRQGAATCRPAQAAVELKWTLALTQNSPLPKTCHWHSDTDTANKNRLLLLSHPDPDGQEALNIWGFRQPLKDGLIQSPNKLTKTTEQEPSPTRHPHTYVN